MSFAVAHRLFRHSADIERADHGAVLGVDRSDMRRGVTENVDPLVGWVEEHAIRIALHLDGLDMLHGLGIEHQDRFAAGEAVIGLGVDYGAMRVRRGDFTDRLERVEIKDADSGSGPGARKIQPASLYIRVNIVIAARAANLDGLQHLVRPRLLGKSEGRKN